MNPIEASPVRVRGPSWARMAGMMRRHARGPVAWTLTSWAMAAVGMTWTVVTGPVWQVVAYSAVSVVCFVMGVRTLRSVRRRRVAEAELARLTDVRPRFGTLHLRSGVDESVVFHPLGDGMFAARHAGDESPVILRQGDRVSADVLGPGQSIVLGTEAR